MSSGHSLAKGTFDKAKIVTYCVNGYSNHSILNNVSYQKISGKDRKDTKKAWIKTNQALLKLSIFALLFFTEDYYDKIQELKRCLLGSQSRHFLLKGDTVPFLFLNTDNANKLR